MNRIRPWHWAAAAAFLFVGAFWVSFASHFPGAGLSRYLEAQLNRDPRLSFRIAPAELGWTRISIPDIRIDGVLDGEPAFLAAFRDSEIPLSFALAHRLSLRSVLAPSGELQVEWPWRDGTARFTARGIRLETLPAIAALRPAPGKAGSGKSTPPVFAAERIQGVIDASGELTVERGLVTGGEVRGQIGNLELGGAHVPGIEIASTRIDAARFQLAIGPVIRIQSFTMDGDFQGTLGGSVTPRPARPDASPLDIQVDIAIRPEWARQLGPLAPLMNSFLDSGRLTGTLRGTVARPVFRPAKARN